MFVRRAFSYKRPFKRTVQRTKTQEASFPVTLFSINCFFELISRLETESSQLFYTAHCRCEPHFRCTHDSPCPSSTCDLHIHSFQSATILLLLLPQLLLLFPLLLQLLFQLLCPIFLFCPSICNNQLFRFRWRKSANKSLSSARFRAWPSSLSSPVQLVFSICFKFSIIAARTARTNHLSGLILPFPISSSFRFFFHFDFVIPFKLTQTLVLERDTIMKARFRHRFHIFSFNSIHSFSNDDVTTNHRLAFLFIVIVRSCLAKPYHSLSTESDQNSSF